MTAVHECPLRPDADDPRQQRADCTAARWLRGLRLLRTDGQPLEVRTGAEDESGVLVLSGTHDLEANSGSWISRGVRLSPFDGRPVALFLPPNTGFRASGGEGDLLLVSARRPTPPPEPEPEPAAKPLLALAGSNKAFDSRSGTWQPIESFPDSPEAILPRRIERATVDGVAVEHVFPFDYKAFGLTVCEAVLAKGQTLTLPGPDAADAFPAEWLVFLRPTARAALAEEEQVQQDAVFWGDGAATVRAVDGACYVMVACAGPKR